MLKVVCLNWNDYLGRGEEYVSKLRSMVWRHLKIPHEFVVVTDTNDDRVGWFKKLTLLEMFDGEVMFFDLDVIISANIDHLVELARTDQSRLWARDDFSYSRVNPRKDVDDAFRVTLGGPGTINSSVMYWNGRRHIEPLAGAHGDQNAITAALWPDQIGLFPNDSIKSWKYHVQRGEGHGDICVFHGEPKPHQVARDGWVDANWR